MTEKGAPEDTGGVVRERLVWQAATRDDARVARALHAGEEVVNIPNNAQVG